MKILIKLTFVLVFLHFIELYAYDENDHMYITIEAYNLLKNQGHCFPEIQDNLGTLNDFGDEPWQTGKITTGAFREDEEDVVFQYTGPPIPFFGSVWVTNGHFWDADEGEDAETHLIGSGVC